MFERWVEVPRLVALMPGSGPIATGPNSLFGESLIEVHEPTLASAEIAITRRDLGQLGALLSQRYGRALSGIMLGYYRDGGDSVAFHGDKLGQLRKDTVVAVVSLGAARKFLLRPVGGRTSHSYLLRGGDLLVMGGDCQETYEHSIPKAQYAGPRIALMFREQNERGRASAVLSPRSLERKLALEDAMQGHFDSAASVFHEKHSGFFGDAPGVVRGDALLQPECLGANVCGFAGDRRHVS